MPVLSKPINMETAEVKQVCLRWNEMKRKYERVDMTTEEIKNHPAKVKFNLNGDISKIALSKII